MNIIKQLKDSNGNNIYPIAYAQGGMKMDLLWTNPNQTSTMADNTNISVDLTDYEWLYVIFVPTLSGTTIANYNYQVNVLKKGFKQVLSYADNSLRVERTFTVDDNGILVGAGRINGSTNPGAFVPMFVYGSKLSYVVPTSVHGLQYVEV